MSLYARSGGATIVEKEHSLVGPVLAGGVGGLILGGILGRGFFGGLGGWGGCYDGYDGRGRGRRDHEDCEFGREYHRKADEVCRLGDEVAMLKSELFTGKAIHEATEPIYRKLEFLQEKLARTECEVTHKVSAKRNVVSLDDICPPAAPLVATAG